MSLSDKPLDLEDLYGYICLKLGYSLGRGDDFTFEMNITKGQLKALLPILEKEVKK